MGPDQNKSIYYRVIKSINDYFLKILKSHLMTISLIIPKRKELKKTRICIFNTSVKGKENSIVVYSMAHVNFV